MLECVKSVCLVWVTTGLLFLSISMPKVERSFKLNSEVNSLLIFYI